MPFQRSAFAALLVCLIPCLTLAQQKPQPPQPNPPAAPPAAPPAQAGRGNGPGGVRVGADPAQFRQQQVDLIKQNLGPTDEQWTALFPKIEKVLDAQRNVRTGAGMSFSSNMNRGQITRTSGGGNATVDTAPGKAMQEIRDALTAENISDDEFVKKLAALREAKEKAKAELAAAQKELKEACTPRQEAVLVTLGQLE